MKNPLESLHTTIGLGVALTAIMVLIVAIFYWETGEATAPAATEQPATTTEQPAASEGQADTSGGDAGATTGTETSN